MYLIALAVALAGVIGGAYAYTPLAPWIGVIVAVSGLVSGAVFWGIGFIISQLYNVNRKLDKLGSDDRKAVQ